MNVRFEGNNGHDADVARCLLLTLSGRRDAELDTFATYGLRRFHDIGEKHDKAPDQKHGASGERHIGHQSYKDPGEQDDHNDRQGQGAVIDEQSDQHPEDSGQHGHGKACALERRVKSDSGKRDHQE